jgi:hypothetical protein
MLARSFTRFARSAVAAPKRLNSSNVPLQQQQLQQQERTCSRAYWLGDSGIYPLMGVGVFALSVCATFTLHLLCEDADEQILENIASMQSRRGPTFYRGELTGDK